MSKFLKGHTTNVGKKKKPFTEATRRKMSVSSWLKGKTWTPEMREKMKNRIPWNKGKKGLQKMSEERKKLLSEKMKGNSYTKGKKLTIEHRRKCGEALRGEKSPNWKGGITKINETIRKSLDYKLWRTAVFQRDRFACIWCGTKGDIHADHIKPFCLFPELRFAIDNGRTLCAPCHRKTDTWGRQALNYK